MCPIASRGATDAAPSGAGGTFTRAVGLARARRAQPGAVVRKRAR